MTHSCTLHYILHSECATVKLQQSREVQTGFSLLHLVGQWADPGGTAMPGQPVTEPEQAPELYPLIKISLISKGGHAPRIRY